VKITAHLSLVQLALLVVSSVFAGNASAQSWNTQSDMKVARVEATTIDYRDDIYVFNGFKPGIKIANSVEKYNATTKQWNIVASSSTLNGTAVTHNGAVRVGTEVWIIGGRIGSHPGRVSNKVWIFNLNTHNWRRGPDLPKPSAAGGAALVNNKIHWIGGIDANASCDVNSHFVYDLGKPAAGWKNITASAGIPTPRNHFSTAVVDNIIYVMGGQFGHDACPGKRTNDSALVHAFNPGNNKWTKKADMPGINSHSEPGTFVYKGDIYTTGGENIGKNKVLKYNPRANQWSTFKTLPESLVAPIARIIDGRLIVAGGGAPSAAKATDKVRSILVDNDPPATQPEPEVPLVIHPEPEPEPGNETIVTVEAESFNGRTSTATHQWINASLPNASGGNSMKTTPDSGALKPGANGSPMLSYNIQFPIAGSYQLWIRGWGDENASGQGVNDSLHAGLNGSLASTADKIDGFPAGWNWSKRTRDGAPAVLQIPSAGTHTVNLWMREDGLAVDKLLLVNNASYVPQGSGPVGNQSNTNTNTASNQAPTVSAEANGSAVVGTAFSLQGQASDDGLPNDTLNFQWTKFSGPGSVSFSQSTTLATTAVFSSTGTYVLKLTASDGSASDSDSVTVVVQPASNNSGNTGTSTGNQSTSGSDLIAIEAENYQSKTAAANQQWVAANIAAANGSGSMTTTPNKGVLKSSASGSPSLSYSVNFDKAGIYHVWIRGWGDENAKGLGTNDSIHAGLNGVLSATADKIDGFPAGWHWSNRTRDGVSAKISVPSAGTHSFNLWMREDGFVVDKIILSKAASFTPTGLGNSSTQTNSGSNTATNSAPVVDAGPGASIMANASVSLAGAVSDDSTPTASLQTLWSKQSGPGTVSFANASSVSTTATFSVAGNYVLKLTANDGALTASDSLNVVVNAVSNNNTSIQNGSGAVAVEAEDYFTKSGTPTHQWVAANLAGASGNASMITTPDKGALKNGSAGSPMMSYPVNFMQAGIHYIWVRGWGDEMSNGAGQNDSVHAGINGVLSNTADKIDGFAAGWHWSNRTRDGQPARINVPSAGIHTVNFWMREDGLAIDKFIVTADASYVPSGNGNVAANESTNGNTSNSNDSSSAGNTNNTGNTSGLLANAGRAWEMVQTANGSAVAGRHEAGAVAVSNDTFYVMGGRGNRPVQSFSETTNIWTNHGTAPVRMNHFQPVVLGNKVYVIGALKDDNYPTELPLEHIYVFDTSNHTWTKGAAIPVNRRRGSVGAAAYNGRIYLVGGNTNGHSGPSVNWFDEYNPANNKWTVMPDAPHARDHVTIAVVGDKLVVAGGRRTAHPNVWGATEAKTDIFNFATGQWQNLADDIPTERAGTMTVTVGNEVVVIGGETLGSADAHRDVEALNVATGKWRQLQPLLEGRHSGGAVVLGDKIHVVSGNTTRGGGNESINHETLQLDGQP